MANPMIDPSTGRVMQAFTFLRGTGLNAVQRKARAQVNTVTNRDRKPSGTGVGGMTTSVPLKNLGKLSNG
jgi:hypothetical protein